MYGLRRKLSEPRMAGPIMAVREEALNPVDWLDPLLEEDFAFARDPPPIFFFRRRRYDHRADARLAALPCQQRAQHRLAVNGISLRPPRTSRKGDRRGIDDMASDLISLEQSMHGKAVKPGFVDRDDLHKLADPSERFRREPAQKDEQ